MNKIHKNSVKAFKEISRESRYQEILDLFERRAWPMTDRMVMGGLGYKDMNCVRPRITELIADNKLEEVEDKQKDHVTGKTVRACRRKATLF